MTLNQNTLGDTISFRVDKFLFVTTPIWKKPSLGDEHPISSGQRGVVRVESEGSPPNCPGVDTAVTLTLELGDNSQGHGMGDPPICVRHN